MLLIVKLLVVQEWTTNQPEGFGENEEDPNCVF